MRAHDSHCRSSNPWPAKLCPGERDLVAVPAPASLAFRFRANGVCRGGGHRRDRLSRCGRAGDDIEIGERTGVGHDGPPLLEPASLDDIRDVVSETRKPPRLGGFGWMTRMRAPRRPISTGGNKIGRGSALASWPDLNDRPHIGQAIRLPGLEPPRTAEALTGMAREERSDTAGPVDPVRVARPLVLGGASI